MNYTLTIMTRPELEVVEDTGFTAECDADAMIYAMNQACFTGAQEYSMFVISEDTGFNAHITGSIGAQSVR